MDNDHLDLPNSSRRRFLRGAAALGAQAALPAVPAWAMQGATSVATTASASIEKVIGNWLETLCGLRYDVIDSMAHTNIYLNIYPEERAAWLKDAQGWLKWYADPQSEGSINQKAFLMEAGEALIGAKPSYEELLGMCKTLDSQRQEAYALDGEEPFFQGLDMEYDAFFAQHHSPEEAAKELYRQSRLTAEELHLFVQDEMAQLHEMAQTLNETTMQVQEEERQAQLLPNFADMPSARKAGGYPVPQGYAGKHSAVGTYHTCSGEWREPASRTGRTWVGEISTRATPRTK